MINLSDTTPAASSGHTNVSWQKDTSGNVSAEIPTPVDAATQAANKVLAGPATGADATPAFRLLVAADIPAIAESQVTSLTTDLAAKVSNARTISTTAPITGGGDLSADRTLAISNFTGDSGSGGAKGAVPAPASGDTAAGKFLKADGSWAVPSGTTAGTVTSVGLTVPSWLSVSGTPVTTSGTLAVTATGAQTANQFLATPNGSTGTVGLRAIAAADLPLATTGAFGAVKPDGTTITISSGVITSTAAGGMTNPMTTAGDIIYGGASGTATRLAGGTSGYVLTSNGATSAPSWQAASSGVSGLTGLLTPNAPDPSTFTLSGSNAVGTTTNYTAGKFFNITLPTSGSSAKYYNRTLLSAPWTIYTVVSIAQSDNTAGNDISLGLYDGSANIIRRQRITMVSSTLRFGWSSLGSDISTSQTNTSWSITTPIFMRIYNDATNVRASWSYDWGATWVDLPSEAVSSISTATNYGFQVSNSSGSTKFGVTFWTFYTV